MQASTAVDWCVLIANDIEPPKCVDANRYNVKWCEILMSDDEL